MPILRQNGYEHNPHSLRDAFLSRTTPNTEKRDSFIYVVTELLIMAAIIILVAALIGQLTARDERKIMVNPCDGMVIEQDANGNTICYAPDMRPQGKIQAKGRD